MLVNSTEEMQGSKLGLYVKALEEEKQKIQVFQRELPLCLELVTQGTYLFISELFFCSLLIG